jgi:hypothetical protein
MSANTLFGIGLIVAGAAMLGYGEFSYKTQEKVIEVGPITATAEKTKTVALPPVLGWALVGGGTLVLLLGAIPRRA